MRRKVASPTGLATREFWYDRAEYADWISAHRRWWRERKDPSVWGRFAAHAACGRYTFSARDQKKLHFGETLVAAELEREGYVCWTSVLILRKPNRTSRGWQAEQTRLVERLLRATGCRVPQREYQKRYVSEGLRLKRIDVVGFHFGRNHWVFAEVKKDRDRLHREQEAGLRFLRTLFPLDRADVFLASVRARPEASAHLVSPVMAPGDQCRRSARSSGS